MTQSTISYEQYEAIQYLIAQSGNSKSGAAIAHRSALSNGGWGSPTLDLSILNSLTDADMTRGLSTGWNVAANLPSDDARQNAAMSIAKNGVYGILPEPGIPAHLSISYEQETAIEEALKSVEHDVEALIYIHRAMRAHGGWTTPGRIALNDLSENDIRGVLSSECKVTVAKPRPVVIEEHRNGLHMTQEQVTAVEDWFAEPENLKYDREDLLRIMKDGNAPASLNVIRHLTTTEMMVALYVGYQPLN